MLGCPTSANDPSVRRAGPAGWWTPLQADPRMAARQAARLQPRLEPVPGCACLRAARPEIASPIPHVQRISLADAAAAGTFLQMDVPGKPASPVSCSRRVWRPGPRNPLPWLGFLWREDKGLLASVGWRTRPAMLTGRRQRQLATDPGAAPTPPPPPEAAERSPGGKACIWREPGAVCTWWPAPASPGAKCWEGCLAHRCTHSWGATFIPQRPYLFLGGHFDSWGLPLSWGDSFIPGGLPSFWGNHTLSWGPHSFLGPTLIPGGHRLLVRACWSWTWPRRSRCVVSHLLHRICDGPGLGTQQ